MGELARIKQIIPAPENMFAMYEWDSVTAKRVACIALVEATSSMCDDQVRAVVLDAAGRFVFAYSIDGFTDMAIIGRY